MQTGEEYDMEECELVWEQFEIEREEGGESCWRNDITRFDFLRIVRAMGWKNVREFTDETGIEYEDIKGQYWMVMGSAEGRTSVYIL